jgi:hypothetical protein
MPKAAKKSVSSKSKKVKSGVTLHQARPPKARTLKEARPK